MIVQAIWEIDIDVEDMNPGYVDIEDYAKDMARYELGLGLYTESISHNDFEYIVKEKKND